MKAFSTFFALLFSLLLVSGASAQDADTTGWKVSADLTLNLTQNSYNDAWEGSESGSIAWSTLALVSAEKQMREKLNWKNTLRLGFGQTHTQADKVSEPGKKSWQKPQKSTDEVDAESVLRFTMGWVVDPYAGLRLKTKFTNANNDLFDPKELTESAGLARKFINTKEASLVARLGFAVRQQMAKDMDTTNDGGAEFVMEYDRILSEGGIKFNSNLRTFKALYYSKSDESNDDWKQVDLDWRNNVSFNIYKAIAVNLYLQLLYDRDKQTEDGIQIKQTLGAGLSYKLL